MTTPSAAAPDAKFEDLTLKLLTQLCVGPSLTEVAGELLRQSLNEQYPDLHIDPNTTLLGTPVWDFDGDKIVSLTPRYLNLSSLLARQAVLKVPTLCIEGQHFLTPLPLTEPAVHLPVRIVEIANTINVLATTLFQAYKEQLVDYWNSSNGNGPHWHELASTLRSAWNVQQVDGWSEDDCTLARSLYHAPDAEDRQPGDQPPPRACLVDIHIMRNGKVIHPHPLVIAVLLKQSEQQTVILCHSLDGHRKFTSMEQLGNYLHEQVYQPEPYERLQWRLYEPTGNFFEHLACALIVMQIDALTGLVDGKQPPPPEAPLSALAGTSEQVTAKGLDLAWYQQALPDWLAQAAPSDRAYYSRHLKDLAALNSLHEGKTYQDDIPSIQQYAQDQLHAQIIADHPEAAHMALDTLTVQVKSQVFWGAFPVPGQVETKMFSLVDLALQNLIALPLGNKSLQMVSRKALPQWLTVDYLEQLITQVNVGSTYLALIRSKLIDDPVESTRRKLLYTQHLRIQLPLLALQHKIRQEHGIDERGYRYVAAIMQDDVADRFVDGHAIVIRHLAFVPKRRRSNAQDMVSNMYVIGAQHDAAGPCLLYRPLFDPVLIQYPSQANLLYAIAQSDTLRESVLAWLPESVRMDYTNYVFPGDLPSPWAVADFLVEPGQLWMFSGPMALGQQALNGDLFTTLFDANAKALVELADHQSVSNAESRWATLKHAGWLIFNAALPFMGRIAGTAAWIWQILDQVQATVEAHEHRASQAQWSALTDVLLNLGMAVILHVATTARPGRAPIKDEPETLPPPADEPVTVEHLPIRTSEQVISVVEMPLNISGAINRTSSSLATLLDSFKTAKPTDLSEAITEEGVYQYLYLHQEHYYAQVGTRWFEVALDGDETLVIVDPKQPARNGPALLHNAQGDWFIDTRLRLRGGGRKSRLKSAMDTAQVKSEVLRDQLAAFEKTKKNAQIDLQEAHEAITDSPGTSGQAEKKRHAYLRKLDNHSVDYEEARQHLMALNVFTPVTEFKQKILGYLKAQLDLNEAGVRELLTTFTPKLKTVLDQLETPQTSMLPSRVEDARAITDMSDDMIKRLEYAQSRYGELRNLAQEGLRMIRSSQSNLPAYTSDDLRALQVTVSRNLCVEPQSSVTGSGAWARINEIVDRADIAVKTLRDAMEERSRARLDERIETLSSLVEQFQFINERLLDFPADYPEQSVTPPVEVLRQLLGKFSERAAAALEPLHIEQEHSRIRPTPPPTPPRPKKKFINTRFNGVLIGEPRLDDAGLETDLVDIKSPVTHNVIATFHQRTPGVWVERPRTKTPKPPAGPVNVAASMVNGQLLLDELSEFRIRASQQIEKPSRTPLGIEHMFHQHAQMLEQASLAIEQALTDTNATESQQPSAAALSKQLNDAAQALYQRATREVQHMIKQRPPTLSGVQWLNEHNLISIKKTVTRRRLKSATKDYLDEYTIIDDAEDGPLWYAHFHYSTADAPVDRFLSARLKTPQEQARGQAADKLRDLNTQQRVDYYRSTINLAQAKRFFFRKKSD